MKALCQIRTQPHYRRYAFEEGLKRAGYSLVESGHPDSREDLLIIWNRYGGYEQMANAWERDGGTVLVCENGYIGRDEVDRQYYAIAVHGHNGSGWFPVGTDDRFAKLGIELEPYKPHGAHIIVRGQRGIGTRDMASPPSWHDETARILRRTQPLPVKVIPHPGNVDPKPTYDEEMRKAEACIIWSSALGVRALTLGIRVFYDAPHWICEAGAQKLNGGGVAVNDECLTSYESRRRAALHEMAWGQRSVAEIETGEPFVTIRERLGECPTW